jgi:hypothetical protein
MCTSCLSQHRFSCCFLCRDFQSAEEKTAEITSYTVYRYEEGMTATLIEMTYKHTTD